MVRKKQTISQEHVQILHDWKERGFVDLEFDFEELTPHYMGTLTKVAKNLSHNVYVDMKLCKTHKLWIFQAGD